MFQKCREGLFALSVFVKGWLVYVDLLFIVVYSIVSHIYSIAFPLLQLQSDDTHTHHTHTLCREGFLFLPCIN